LTGSRAQRLMIVYAPRLVQFGPLSSELGATKIASQNLAGKIVRSSITQPCIAQLRRNLLGWCIIDVEI